ncbi:MAG: replication initiator protein A [Gemmatimonadaceae bacterium]|nr:replication initiator protein A [Gemmatimonadaceae bacterium]MDQ3244555.1 replication initiator protein A [Gemmatimonadota bacterium]
MTLAARRRPANRAITLDRSLEALPIFRLSDSADESTITYSPPSGGRWRVLPSPGDRLPGTFDQDVYIEILHRYSEAGFPDDGTVSFTLHSFLRSIARRVDGRTYEQLRSALTRLERTTLESSGVYTAAGSPAPADHRFTILSSVAIERRRLADREQFTLFPVLTASEPGDARVTISPLLRGNIAAGSTVVLSSPLYQSLTNPVARRLYRLLEVARVLGTVTWRVALDDLAQQLPLAQRYPSHLQRVLQPANEMLVGAGLVRSAAFRQVAREWFVDYVLASRNA